MIDPSERPSPLDNPHAERVRRVAGLAGRSARIRSGRILVEGPQAVRELVRHRAAHLVDVYLTEEAVARYPEIDREARAVTPWVHAVSEDVARAMSTEAQGVVAVAEADAIGGDPVSPASRAPSSIVVLAQSQDPGNAGTIIRTADAMGARGVLVTAGSVDVRSPKVIRSSAGSVFHLPVLTGVDAAQAVDRLHGAGVRVLGTSGADGSVDLADLLAAGLGGEDAVLAGPHAWVMGNEARGLSDAQEALCDLLVRIPMTGRAESLNVASAAAICLFASQTVRAARRTVEADPLA